MKECNKIPDLNLLLRSIQPEFDSAVELGRLLVATPLVRRLKVSPDEVSALAASSSPSASPRTKFTRCSAPGFCCPTLGRLLENKTKQKLC